LYCGARSFWCGCPTGPSDENVTVVLQIEIYRDYIAELAAGDGYDSLAGNPAGTDAVSKPVGPESAPFP
jgi:hypothetical protein